LESGQNIGNIYGNMIWTEIIWSLGKIFGNIYVNMIWTETIWSLGKIIGNIYVNMIWTEIYARIWRVDKIGERLGKFVNIIWKLRFGSIEHELNSL
jgi:hypothetical protein